MMTRETKQVQIKSLSEKFGRAKAAFLVDFKGMDVEGVTALRKKLRPAESEMKVVRNTLAKQALKEHPSVEKVISADFVGTNAVIFAYGDVAQSAKTLSDFAKNNEHMQIKSGYMEGEHLNEDKIKFLSTLPTKDVLRAQFLGVLTAPMQQFVSVLNAVPSGFARVLGSYKDKKEKEGQA